MSAELRATIENIDTAIVAARSADALIGNINAAVFAAKLMAEQAERLEGERQTIPPELYEIRDVSGATGIRKFFLDGLLALETDARELVEWQDRGGVPHRRDFLPLEAAAIGAEYLDAKYSDVLAASWVSYLNRIIDHVTQNDVLYPYARGLPDRTIRYSLQIRGAGMTPVVQLIINELRDVAFNDQATLKTLYEEWQKGRAQ